MILLPPRASLARRTGGIRKGPLISVALALGATAALLSFIQRQRDMIDPTLIGSQSLPPPATPVVLPSPPVTPQTPPSSPSSPETQNGQPHPGSTPPPATTPTPQPVPAPSPTPIPTPAPQSPVFTGKVLAGTTAPILIFTKTDYEKALQSNRLIVLFFYANWCPICKEEVPNALLPAFNDLKTDTVVGFLVNFNDSDTDNDEREVARTYGVPYQHTKVFIRNNKELSQSPASWNKERYLKEINAALAQ